MGRINAGIRENIMPEYAEMAGTIRSLDADMQQKMHDKIKLTATKIAESAGARAEVTIENKTPVTYNDPAPTERTALSLERTAGEKNVTRIPAVTGAERLCVLPAESTWFFFSLAHVLPMLIRPRHLRTIHRIL